MFKTYDEQPIATETPIALTVDEENMLRHACEYLTRKTSSKVSEVTW